MKRIVPSLLIVLSLSGLGAAEHIHPITRLDLPDEESSREEEGQQPLAQQLAEIKIRRTPALLAQALARLPTLPPPGEDAGKLAERYVLLIAAGDWSAVGAFLATQPEKTARHLYGNLLNQLDEGLITPEDVLALAAIAPGGLDDERIQQLGGVLRAALRQTDAIEALLARLDAGAGTLGGSAPAARARAAALLLAADRDADAGRFLPPLAEARASGDVRVLDLHARVQLARATRDQDAAAQAGAWDCSLAVLASSGEAEAELRTAAAARIVAMLPRLPRDQGDAWMDACFQGGGEAARLTLSALIGSAGQRLQGRDPGERLPPLQLIHRAAQSLLAVRDPAPWRPFLNALAMPWQIEAELVVGGSDAARRPWMGNDREEPEEIPADALADLAPSEAWLGQLDASLGLRLRRLSVEVIVRGADTMRGLALLGGLRGAQPEASDRLAEAMLASWVQRQRGGRVSGGNEGEYQRQLRNYRQQLPQLSAHQRTQWRQYLQRIRNGEQDGGGDPVTRARQVRLLGDLAGLLQRMHAAQLRLSAEAVVQAFSACHSQAEVFQSEDIAAVFGDPAALDPATRVALAAAMRGRLADTWRNPAVQQQAKSNRSDAETAAETERGYALAVALLPDRLPETALLRAVLAYDYAEFRYGRKAPLAEYAGLRDRAWADFSAAADFAAQRGDPASAEVQLAWFRAALGASDLAQLTRQAEADPGQMRRIATTLRAGGKADGDERTRRFATGIAEAMDEVEGSLRPRFLRKAVEIIGTHPAGETLRRRLAGYDEIAAEVALQLRPEGDAAVGTSPFAASLVLQHSSAIGREAGGFGRYLNRQAQHRSGVQVNYLGDFEKSIRETLEPRFRIHALRFQTPAVQPRGCERSGWRETPLAHLVLSARDPSVDRLPPLRLDLDFPDGSGQVILPVASAAVAIDARGAAAPRPWTAGEVVMTFDQRDPARLALDIEAHGRGLPGELATILGIAPGMTAEDQGLALVGDEDAGGVLHPLGERRWRVTWTPGEAGSFTFPAVSDASVKVVRRRWQDGEAVDSPATVELPGPAPRWWPWVVAGLGALAAGLLAWRWLRRRRPSAVAGGWEVPATCTPFSVAALLGRIQAEAQLDEQARTALQADRQGLEQACFAPAAAGPPDAAALGGLARRWADAANRALSP